MRDHKKRTAWNKEHCDAADVNDKLIIHLRDLSHMMRFLYEGKGSQKRILIVLNEIGGSITQRELTERLGIQPGSASEILAKLENAGLIVRSSNEFDRRTIDVNLTDDGRALAAEALEQRKKRHEEMFSCLSEVERQELLALLERVCGDWKSRYCESEDMHKHERQHPMHHGRHKVQEHHDDKNGYGAD